jgi:hypothetical protein
MNELKIKSQAVLVGYDADGKCIYSDFLDLSDYYDGEHVWDDAKKVKKMKLRKVKGYLFDSEGVLDQEFESVFNSQTGIYSSGYAKFADGTVRKDEEKA